MWLVYSKRSLKSQLSTHITDISLRQYARALYKYIYSKPRSVTAMTEIFE